MRIVDQYILRSVLATVTLALLMLAGLDTLFSFIAELEDLDAFYNLTDALIYSVATFPRRTYEFIPIATLIGCILSLGMLSSSSELVVMRTAGISVARIVYAVFRAVALVVIFGLVLGQFIMPNTERYAQGYRALQQGGGTTLKVNQGIWHRDGDSIIHINAIAPHGVMLGVTRYRITEENELLETSFSERARYMGGELLGAQGLWSLEKTRTTELQKDRIKVDQIKSKSWQTNFDPKLINLVFLNPDYLSITGLHKYSVHMREEGLSYKAYSLAFWKKVMQPLATLAMVAISVSFVFGPLRSVTMGFRVMIGLIVGLVFNYTQELLGYSSLVFDVQPWLAATTPVAGFMLLGAILISRVR